MQITIHLSNVNAEGYTAPGTLLLKRCIVVANTTKQSAETVVALQDSILCGTSKSDQRHHCTHKGFRKFPQRPIHC